LLRTVEENIAPNGIRNTDSPARNGSLHRLSYLCRGKGRWLMYLVFPQVGLGHGAVGFIFCKFVFPFFFYEKLRAVLV
jgi:hypothetical protein